MRSKAKTRAWHPQLRPLLLRLRLPPLQLLFMELLQMKQPSSIPSMMKDCSTMWPRLSRQSSSTRRNERKPILKRMKRTRLIRRIWATTRDCHTAATSSLQMPTEDFMCSNISVLHGPSSSYVFNVPTFAFSFLQHATIVIGVLLIASVQLYSELCTAQYQWHYQST